MTKNKMIQTLCALAITASATISANAASLHIGTRLAPNYERIDGTMLGQEVLQLSSKTHKCAIPASFATKAGSTLERLSSQILSDVVDRIICEENSSRMSPASYVAIGYAGPFFTTLTIAGKKVGYINSVHVGDYGLTVSTSKNRSCVITAKYAKTQLSTDLFSLGESLQSTKITDIACDQDSYFDEAQDNNIVVTSKN